MYPKLTLPLSFALLAICAGCSLNPAPISSQASQLRASCGPVTVQIQTSAAEVLALCGQPSYRDAWGGAAAPSGPDVAAVEEWYYNQGPDRPVQVLRFLKGRLISVAQDGLGFDRKKVVGACQQQAITTGLSKYRLVQVCGQPLTRQAYIVDPSYNFPNAPILSQGNAVIVGQTQFARPVYREELAYSLAGAVKTVTLENGRVVGVSNVIRRG